MMESVDSQAGMQDLYRLLVENSLQGQAVMQDGRFVYLNEAFARSVGHSVEELLSASIFDQAAVIHPEDRHMVRERMRRRLAGETDAPRQELRIVDRLGRVYWMEGYSIPITYAGRPAVHVTFIDITHRKLMEEELRRSEARERARAAEMRAIMDAAPAAIWIAHDRECKRVTGNRAGNMLLGALPEQNLSATAPQGERPENFSIVRSGAPVRPEELPLQRAAALGESSQGVEQELVFLDGKRRYLWGNVAPLWDEQGRPRGAVGAFVDITERRQAEAALRESEEKLRTLVDCISDLVFTLDLEQRHTGMYGAWSGRFGYVAAQFQGMTLREMGPTINTALHEAMNARALAGEAVLYQWEAQTPAGGRWMQTSLSPLRGDDGRIRGLVGVGRDISELKRAEESLRRRNQDLLLLNRAAREFNGSLNLDDVLRRVLEQTSAFFGSARTTVWLYDAEGDALVCRQGMGAGRERLQGHRLGRNEGFPGWVFEHGVSLNVGDHLSDARRAVLPNEDTHSIRRSVLSVPLRVRDQILGVLQVARIGVNQFMPEDQAWCEALAAMAATAVENARLYEMTRRDAETQAVLIQEINHRVKNNLSAILGLLYTERQLADVRQPADFPLVMDHVIGRVRALATTHDMLTRAGWGEIRLSDLATQVLHSAITLTAGDKLAMLDVEPSPVAVGPAQAQNVALVINELATNSIKHAEAQGGVLHIRARFAREGDQVVVELRDDGQGFPDDALRPARGGIGLALVQQIVIGALGGRVTFGNENGALARISFPIKE